MKFSILPLVVALASSAVTTAAAISSYSTETIQLYVTSVVTSTTTITVHTAGFPQTFSFGNSSVNAIYTTVTDQSTTVVTITSCSDNACATTAVTTGVTVVTATVEGVVTEYTTYCPLTGESTSPVAQQSTSPVAQQSAPPIIQQSAPPIIQQSASPVAQQSTVVATITSCSDNVCSTTAVTTGATVVTTTVNNVETIYTTYCPLTAESTAPASGDVTLTHVIQSTVVVTLPHTPAATTGVTVLTTSVNNQGTTNTTVHPLTPAVVTPVVPANNFTLIPPVSTFEGAANALTAAGLTKIVGFVGMALMLL
ncbi:hypothetical protein BABINDRAFT_163005 [Babjeviella inositovora NRRL Y-12698]|uniref:Uncharacterized protein n=1 Tax=Babjeviella inositovora NRRL Y-12698 TaxID=984486 RepID=A0A1E3QLV0_9ASCO|nr:uncharacterized protein BABINDRAFT_163005 [Babjeviella inositovora NRRL Y-12698]ODQ77957.1 hypothetical protein BABINDRAFT_163005 [Babjeviella inositovora NRRL Y-12698]